MLAAGAAAGFTLRKRCCAGTVLRRVTSRSMDRWPGVLVALVAMVALLLGCSSDERGAPNAPLSRMNLEDGWQYRWGASPRHADGQLAWLDASEDGAKWKSARLPGYPPRPAGAGRRLWMRTTIPEGQWRDPVLMIDAVISEYEVYVDGERVGAFGSLDSATPTADGLTWRAIRLPPNAAGKPLVLRIRTVLWFAGVRGTVYVGSRASHERAILRSDIGAFASGMLAAVLGALSLVWMLWSRGDRALALFSFGVYAMGTGLYSVYYTKLKSLLWHAPVLWHDIYRVAVHAGFIGILMFVERVFGAGPRRLVSRLWTLHVALFVVDQLYSYSFGLRGPWSTGALWPIATAFIVSRVLFAIEVLVVLGVVGQRAFRKDTDARIFLAGLIPASASALRDVLAAFGLVRFDWDSYTFVGVLAFVGALLVIAQRQRDARLRRLTLELAERAKDKARMLKDLHDGIGGIATNISLLSDVAAQAPSAEQQRQAIAAIGDLSREGIAEVRELLTTVDPSERSWETLAKQIRAMGTQLFGPRDVRFVFSSAIADSSTTPPGDAYANLLRVAREALTNAAKHAKPSYVEAKLSIDTGRAGLRIENDGAPEATAEEPGIGLRTMRERAEELGGSFEYVQSEGTTSVTFSLPLDSLPAV